MPRARSLAFTVAAGALLAYLLWRIFAPFVAPIAWAAVLAILLAPGHRRIRERVRRPNLAAFLATALTILVVVIPAVVLVATLLRQGAHLYGILSDFVKSYRMTSASDMVRIPMFQKLIARISSIVPIGADDVRGWIDAGLKSIAARSAGVASNLAIGFLGVVASFFIMVFTLFFFFRDGEALWRHLTAAIPMEVEKTARLVARLDAVMHAVLIGTLLTAVLQGALGAIGFAVFGLPSPIVFGAVMAALSLLPVGGTALVWLPAGIILLAQGHWGKGIGILAWGALIVGLADNWFKPMIISGRSEMNTLPVFFGVMGGLAAFGFLGLFVGPMFVALGIAVWETAAGPVEARINGTIGEGG